MPLGIELSNGGYAIVDDDAPPVIFQMLWCRVTSKSGINYARGRFCKRLGGHGRVVLMHRLLLKAPAGREFVVDHINGDGLDNRMENLQIVTQSRNLMKSRRALAGGVTFDKENWAWSARARVDGTPYHLGFFDTEEAARAVVTAFRREAWTMPHNELGAILPEGAL